MNTLICAAMLVAVLIGVGSWATGQLRAVRRFRAGGES